MVVLYSEIFKQFPEIIFGLSTKADEGNNSPYGFNISYSVGDDENKVKENRERFFNELGLNSHIAFQKQIHSDIVIYAEKPGARGDSDAMFTDKRNLGLSVTIADCTPIFLYNPVKKIIAAVHSGWRGTQKNILGKTLTRLAGLYDSKAKDIYAYIGPSICRKDYEVGKEVADLFDGKYLTPRNDKFLLGVSEVCYDTLLKAGVPRNQVEASGLCTFEEKDLLHSYRRDGKLSGRMMGVIALK